MYIVQPQRIEDNWMNGNWNYLQSQSTFFNERNLTIVSNFQMNGKQIIQSLSKNCIHVYNRWTSEIEHVHLI